MTEDPAGQSETNVPECDAEEEYNAGIGYSDGPGKDVPKAVYHLRLSADNGNADASEALADLACKERFEGWKPCAETYYRKAIAAGSDTALLKLADLYYLGDWDAENFADPRFHDLLNKRAGLLYFEYVQRDTSADREKTILGRMLSSSWLSSAWSYYGKLVEFLAEDGNDDALHIYLDGDIPEPTEQYELSDLLAEKFELPALVSPETKPQSRRSWGRTRGRRKVTSLLFDMGIEFSKSSNGLIKTKKGKEIEDQMARMEAMGYKFKYIPGSDRWTYMDKKSE